MILPTMMFLWAEIDLTILLSWDSVFEERCHAEFRLEIRRPCADQKIELDILRFDPSLFLSGLIAD